ncbi:MAG: MBL fold metallo-hydrolase [Thermoflexales bacterium]|nr:MBL fold metallo-hydrolase [Thermoflexales bacterium]MCS7323812.1 MBL fold metallo-hydrolase [Thermoflexales bacterium]MCX7938871.1 MBL fold metallo-hydrolase [Thermoflexales bacterium]MDW8053946.1 MBL fold metallo-hydrolase [Anaerolineae bacterium]MDW8292488.1 MBL fold metallo-hydrolase [Anaerolineae bacterium]
MSWERASEDVYVFTSDRYAQVNASLVVAEGIGVLIDTLPFPEETLQIAMLARRVCPQGIRCIIYTSHEADHVYGAFLFPGAEIIAHEQCLETLRLHGEAALQRAKASTPELAPVRLRLPTITFRQGSLTLRLPSKTLEITHTPGHAPDSIVVLLHEESILFAGDTVMALPAIAQGDPDQLKQSLERISNMSLENIVQGHGEIILRGEIKDTLKRQIAYLDTLRSRVTKIVEAGGSREDVKAITLESCGMQRILLNGFAPQVHLANALAIYDRLAAARASAEAAPSARPSRAKSGETSAGAEATDAAHSRKRARTTKTTRTKSKANPKSTTKKSNATKAKKDKKGKSSAKRKTKPAKKKGKRP